MRTSASGLLMLAALLAGNAVAHEKSQTPAVVLAPGYSTLNYDAPVPGSYQLPPVQPAAEGEEPRANLRRETGRSW